MSPRPYPLADRALRACLDRSEHAGPGQAESGLAIYRRAADAFAVWDLGCSQKACRRAGRCAGIPLSGQTSYPHPLPPCLDEDRFRALRDWLIETYGGAPPRPGAASRPDAGGNRPAGKSGTRRAATAGAATTDTGQHPEGGPPLVVTALELLRAAVEAGRYGRTMSGGRP